MIYYYPNTTVAPTPSPSTQKVRCEYFSNGFEITSSVHIECLGNGATYCETDKGSTCSTDSPYGSVNCTTKSDL
ncbi:hypothetical protein DICPUDRAFT_149859 [Dictyostelium purpureum]|uniref:Uncharacterized protein n=1 Tax=Dictyostelium purpureum TaxID=5786 RepID=F0ZEU0_DICPU|nr:uncharacterized protein DICPUDRAFT_149859 [Dictyostelium purpureum]EGC37552.1 hypothetical protein DICPUDRAFT_149859 [Dictyostelium purpureum]|eukprot:XP_003285943.1 hypothetical protein DICPUDRAFT_149859 [Dictyostelium purpureum]